MEIMNILFLSELFYPHGSGAELATSLYAKLLSGAGIDVVVITSKFAGEPPSSRNENLTIYRLPLVEEHKSVKYSVMKRSDILFSGFVRKMMEWADVVYVPRFWYSAIPLAKAHKKPVIVHLHDYFPICPLSISYNFSKTAVCDQHHILCPLRCIYTYEKNQNRGFKETLLSVALNSSAGRCLSRFVKFSDAIICVAKKQRDIIIEKKPELRGKTYVAYNPLPVSSNARALDIEGDDFGYFGGPDYLKGFHSLCQAMIEVNNAKRKLTKIHITKFPDSKGQLASSLSKLGFLLYRRLNDSELEKVYRQIRAVVVPSLWHEPSPYVIDEAMCLGRVVIASRIGGIPEQVDGSKGAFLFEAGNIKQLAETINFVEDLTRETIIDLGAQNRESLLKRRNNRRTIQGFMDVVAKVL